MPAGVVREKQRFAAMSAEELAVYLSRRAELAGEPLEVVARRTAWRHGYGCNSPAYWDRIRSNLPPAPSVSVAART